MRSESLLVSYVTQLRPLGLSRTRLRNHREAAVTREAALYIDLIPLSLIKVFTEREKGAIALEVYFLEVYFLKVY